MNVTLILKFQYLCKHSVCYTIIGLNFNNIMFNGFDLA